MQIESIYIGLGANLSNPKSTFLQALEHFSQFSINIVQVSGLWRSPAWPANSGQPDYINACAELGFGGNAVELLNILHQIEAELGRVRSVKNAARTVDLDLLDFRGQVTGAPDDKDFSHDSKDSAGLKPSECHISENSGIILPHPRMLSRGFVLLPLKDIAPDWHDPIDHISLEVHIAKLPPQDRDAVKYIEPLKDL